MALYIPHSIFHLARLLYVRPETFGPYYVCMYVCKYVTVHLRNKLHQLQWFLTQLKSKLRKLFVWPPYFYFIFLKKIKR